MKLKLLMALCLMMSLSAHGQDGQSRSYLNGTQLMELCESDRKDLQFMCGYYLIGLIDGFKGGSRRGGVELPYCLPPDVGLVQLRKIVMKHYSDNPEDLHYTVDSTVMVLMQDTFPCTD